LAARPKLKKTLYFASSGDSGLALIAQRLTEVLSKSASPAISWHYERMPEEKHSTIYHPAALKAFRALFKPSAGK
jgi:hypothetical protein